MELVISILLAISLMGNYFQHEKVTDLKQERTEAVEASESNLESYKIALEVNKDNETIITELNESLENCNSDLKSEIDKINNWKEADRLKAIAIENITERLDGIDFGANCRVPDFVDLEA